MTEEKGHDCPAVFSGHSHNSRIGPDRQLIERTTLLIVPPLNDPKETRRDPHCTNA